LQEKSFAVKSSGFSKNIFSYEDLEFRPAKIKKIVDESLKVKSFYLEHHSKELPVPGQFVMVWLPGYEEVPMSISDAGKSFIRISVSKEGLTTSEFHKLKSGDKLFLRGPFGKGFSTEGKSFLIVGGGYGTAPLIYAAKVISRKNGKLGYLVGAKNKSELLFLKEARRLGEVQVTTEDGSMGHRGIITDLVEPILDKKDFDSVLTCGPERMMYKVVQYCVNRGIQVQASLERYMKCGFGICGSCVLDPIGLRVCVDGPVFDGKLLLKTEFGNRKRDASGSRIAI